MESGELGDSCNPRSRPRLILKIHPNGFPFSSSSAFKVWMRDDHQGGCNNNTSIAPSSNLQINGAAENVNGGGGAKSSKCTVCSKTFRSEKALHGHMRCHPDRDWRGTIPPPAPKTTHSSSSVVSSDIPPPPRRCCKTGRRGQNCIINSDSSPPFITSLHQKRMEENHRSDYPSKKPKVRTQDAAAHKSSRESFLETRKYKCKTCHKVFPTLQDLVRNMSSDSYKETPTMGNSNNMYAAPHGEKGLPFASNFRHVKQAQKSHKCKICNKTFPTGQALGGHHTIHRPKSAQPQPEPDTPQQQQPVLMLTFHEEAKQNEGPRVLDFDINELPPVEEEEQPQNLCSIVHPFP